MSSFLRSVCGGVVVIAIAMMAPLAAGGTLTPPAGPVAPTPGPEPRIAISATSTPGDADSIFRITAPGSYYLAGNVTGQSGKGAIEIEASNVSLDLMGFSILGTAGSEDGIRVIGAMKNLDVRNGKITGWGQDGLSCGSTLGGVIEEITVADNGGLGIYAGDQFVIARCVARNNTVAGIRGHNSCAIRDCIADSNDGAGIVGVFTCAITASTATNSGDDGILVTGSGNTVSGCTAASNGGAGISVLSSDCRIDSNNCTTNARGIHVTATGNIIMRNTCSGSTTANYDVAGGNSLLVVFAPFSAAVVGDFGGTAPSTNPWANFAY